MPIEQVELGRRRHCGVAATPWAGGTKRSSRPCQIVTGGAIASRSSPSRRAAPGRRRTNPRSRSQRVPDSDGDEPGVLAREHRRVGRRDEIAERLSHLLAGDRPKLLRVTFDEVLEVRGPGSGGALRPGSSSSRPCRPTSRGLSRRSGRRRRSWRRQPPARAGARRTRGVRPATGAADGEEALAAERIGHDRRVGRAVGDGAPSARSRSA